MKARPTTLFTVLLLLSIGGSAQGALLYALDDGTSETALGTGQGNDLLWLNSFDTQPGAELITAIQVQWGISTSFTGADLPVSVLLYDDPNNDGNPMDAVLLTSAMTTAMQYGTGNYVEVAIAPTEVSGGFFVAALLEDAPDGSTFMAALDTTTPAGRSWALAGDLDPNDLSAAQNLPNGINPPTDANFALRAVGEAAARPIPEPSAAALFVAGGALVSQSLRRRKR
jgi:hypothetical protein